MTSLEDIAASYAAERSYQWDLGDVIDSSDSVLAIGNTKESTTQLTDLSGTGNHGTINGCMPSAGFFLGRRYDGVDDYIDCGEGGGVFDFTQPFRTFHIFSIPTFVANEGALIEKGYNTGDGGWMVWIRPGLSQIRMYSRKSTRATVSSVPTNKIHVVETVYDGINATIYINGIIGDSQSYNLYPADNTNDVAISKYSTHYTEYKNYMTVLSNENYSLSNVQHRFNAIATLPFWSINFQDYPDNVATYTERLPYSTTVISSGTFKKDAGVLDCVSAGTITYRVAHDFDGSEYIAVTIGGVEYSGTGTITQGNTTVSVAQGSNKITVAMGTADTINRIDIQFREEV